MHKYKEKNACVRRWSWWHFSVNVYNGARWLWEQECRRERSLFVASDLIALWLRSTGSHEVRLFYICVCVCMCYSQASHMSGKWEVTCCLLKHQTSQPLNHIHIHNSLLTHCGAFSSVVPEYHENVDTHTHASSGRGYFASVFVESAPERLFSYQDDLLTPNWAVGLHKLFAYPS